MSDIVKRKRNSLPVVAASLGNVSAQSTSADDSAIVGPGKKKKDELEIFMDRIKEIKCKLKLFYKFMISIRSI